MRLAPGVEDCRDAGKDEGSGRTDADANAEETKNQVAKEDTPTYHSALADHEQERFLSGLEGSELRPCRRSCRH